MADPEPIGVVLATDGCQEEALRVAVGLSALGDVLRIFLLAPEPPRTKTAAQMLAMLEELGHERYADRAGVSGFQVLAADDLADRLLGCRHTVTF